VTDGDYRGRFVNSLAFGLDRFQVEAIDAVDEHVNVAGQCADRVGQDVDRQLRDRPHLRTRERAFTPRHSGALESEVRRTLRSLRERRVGLLTGDVSINASAEVVVMTTRSPAQHAADRIAPTEHARPGRADEVHYLQDPFRGGVWEEVIILTPAAVRFVALSATIGNANFIGEWFAEVRGPTAIIVENERPIQLHNHLAVMRRGQVSVEIVDLLDGERLSDEARRIRQPHEGNQEVPTGTEVEGT